MHHCPYFLPDNRCQVASQLGDCAVQANASACEACQASGPPGVNVVTIELAIAQRRRLGKPTSELERLLKKHLSVIESTETLQHRQHRPGPGNELKRTLAWFATSNNCETRADTMNDWGAAGCRTNLDTIVEWLMEEAQVRGLPHGRISRLIAPNLVFTAIRRFERKFPDGPPEPNDEDQLDEEDR